VDAVYLSVASMLVQIAPAVFDSGEFALKGGTAINLFVRDMPRLSVDLDLVLRDGSLPRARALARIGSSLARARELLRVSGYTVSDRSAAGATEAKLNVARDRIDVEVEVNHVMRGTVRPIRMASLTPTASSTLKASLTLPVLADDELYGSKLVAAMDRQHPRDLFDVGELLAAEGFTPDVVECFVAYLACHNRPIHEVLFPHVKDIGREYADNFAGMTGVDIPKAHLEGVRTHMLDELPRRLTPGQRQFLVTLARAKPDFAALGLPQLEPLPGMQWKLANLRKLRDSNPAKLEAQADELERRLEAIA
jgi:hypothetical protein